MDEATNKLIQIHDQDTRIMGTMQRRLDEVLSVLGRLVTAEPGTVEAIRARREANRLLAEAVQWRREGIDG